MDWIVGALVTIAVLLALKFFFSSQAPGRNRGRQDFERIIRALLILRDNGGRLHVQQRRADLAFDFVRAEGGDDDAILILRVPHAPWSTERGEKLRDLFESNALDVRFIEDPGSKALLEVRIPVEDIWAEWSGARAARAAHLLLDAFAVPREATFDLTLHGPGSWRGPRRHWQDLGDG